MDQCRNSMPSDEDTHLAIWLDKMLTAEPDLRQSLGVKKEAKRAQKIPRIILLEDGEPAAYAELRRVGRAVELATVVVDPAHRGRGLCHDIVHQGWERWRQDPIVHGQPIMPKVNLAQASRPEGEGSQKSIIRGPLISFTRDAAMAAALTGGGFTMLPRKRRASRLWLWKSDFAALPISIQMSLFFDRFFRGLRLLFTKPSGLLHYLKHVRNYRLFARVPEDAERLPPRMHSRSLRDSESEHGIASDVLKRLEV
ncbi:MAG: GNAT family N-acetyltransferase, partial [Candidatus Thermoplasmatota archaeon]|nr:GNAT family N-acetyltransferase [Candidatus Thermoplasmatota archaeon]